jgi:hypothetical protein
MRSLNFQGQRELHIAVEVEESGSNWARPGEFLLLIALREYAFECHSMLQHERKQLFHWECCCRVVY